MAAEQIVIGGDRPVFDTVFGIDGQAFGRNESGKRFYSTMMSTGDKAEELSVGLDLLLDGWTRRDNEPESAVSVFEGDARLRSTGEGTRRLARTWSHALGLPYKAPHEGMGHVVVEAVAFESDPAEIQSAGFKGKLWLGEYGDADECQVYLRVTPASNRAWFGEKSPRDTRNFVEWLARLG